MNLQLEYKLKTIRNIKYDSTNTGSNSMLLVQYRNT